MDFDSVTRTAETIRGQLAKVIVGLDGVLDQTLVGASWRADTSCWKGPRHGQTPPSVIPLWSWKNAKGKSLSRTPPILSSEER